MATTVYVGSARSDEHGGAHGGAAGDQTGKELSTQKWYQHKKGWRVVRANDPEVAEKIARAMQAACDNPHIGYDQYQRQTLFNVSAKLDPPFWPGAVKTACETDCSALVRVCVAYAFGRDIIGSVIGETRFSTANQVGFMAKTGQFTELKGAEYTESPDRLMRGDVLVTATQAHTVVVMNSGDKAVEPAAPKELGSRILKLTSPLTKGDDVQDMQSRLNLQGYGCGEADGAYGPNTEKGVKAFQKAQKLKVDGEFGPKSLAALEALESKPAPQYVRVVKGKWNVRTGPATTYKYQGVAHEGEKFYYLGEMENNWYKINFNGVPAWVTSKGSVLE